MAESIDLDDFRWETHVLVPEKFIHSATVIQADREFFYKNVQSLIDDVNREAALQLDPLDIMKEGALNYLSVALRMNFLAAAHNLLRRVSDRYPNIKCMKRLKHRMGLRWLDHAIGLRLHWVSSVVLADQLPPAVLWNGVPECADDLKLPNIAKVIRAGIRWQFGADPS